MLKFLVLGLSLVSILIACSNSSQEIVRWYPMEQVTVGQSLYASHCASCHGNNGQGDNNWEKALPGGSYPPPPLNGSGHAWHHSLSQLKGTVAKGGRHPGATMPGFEDVLNEQERLAVISFFQEQWDDGTYKAWLKKGGLSQ